jgi:hypothetical protein
MIKYENVNIKGIEHNYGKRLYLKLVLNKLKVIGGRTFICTSLGLGWMVKCFQKSKQILLLFLQCHKPTLKMQMKMNTKLL